MIKAQLIGKTISTNESEAFTLHKKSNFGEPVGEKIQYILSEAFFLVEKKKIEIYSKNKKISKTELLKKLQKIDKKFSIKYPVFKDLREKGYIIKKDRNSAIQLAVRASAPGDTILIAGKGHETYQIIGDQTLPFDDRERARAALATLSNS